MLKTRGNKLISYHIGKKIKPTERIEELKLGEEFGVKIETLFFMINVCLKYNIYQKTGDG